MPKLNLPALYAIIDVNQEEDFKDHFQGKGSLLLEALNASLRTIQLRCKNISKHDIEKLVEEVCKYRKKVDSKSLIILNDYVSIAKKYNLDGVHLGQNDEDPVKAREICGENMIIGLSCHNLEDLRSAPLEALNYLACGPIYTSTTKSGHAPEVGIGGLNLFCKEAPLPVVAIGGITLASAAPVFKAGAASCAVISELKRAQNILSLAKEFDSLRLNS